jgi:hypothetical protein
MAHMPATITVGRLTYTVRSDKESWHDYGQTQAVSQHDHGASQHHELTILVNPSDHPHQQADTLLHEVMHCVWFQASASLINPTQESDREEHTISVLCPWLTMVLAQNPDLARFIEDPEAGPAAAGS